MNDTLQRLDTEVTMALAGLDARAMQLAPREQAGKWTIQQIAEHLRLTLEATMKLLGERLERGTALVGRPGLGQGIGQWLVLSRGWLPSGRSAPDAVIPNRPVTLKTGDQLADKVHGTLIEFDRLGMRTQKRFGSRAVASHSALGALSTEQWRRFHLVHGQHHLKQIARIRREWDV
jgi:hypothetical protein